MSSFNGTFPSRVVERQSAETTRHRLKRARLGHKPVKQHPASDGNQHGCRNRVGSMIKKGLHNLHDGSTAYKAYKARSHKQLRRTIRVCRYHETCRLLGRFRTGRRMVGIARLNGSKFVNRVPTYQKSQCLHNHIHRISFHRRVQQGLCSGNRDLHLALNHTLSNLPSLFPFALVAQRLQHCIACYIVWNRGQEILERVLDCGG
mmetsp:Transcript_8907/g.15613  ORF Transcript_8907/g.15613 Transcript_8907/m.15613 type:complete len:204 (+) Transcript_8907:616-1227(+)